jgi:hypothetical protein
MYTMTPVQERVLMKCMENRVALYSPHTSWDAIQGELNLLIHDWKRKGGGGGAGGHEWNVLLFTNSKSGGRSSRGFMITAFVALSAFHW